MVSAQGSSPKTYSRCGRLPGARPVHSCELRARRRSAFELGKHLQDDRLPRRDKLRQMITISAIGLPTPRPHNGFSQIGRASQPNPPIYAHSTKGLVPRSRSRIRFVPWCHTGSWAFYKLRDDQILQVICRTCQNVFAGSRVPASARLLCMGLFSIFWVREPLRPCGWPAGRSSRPPSPKSASAWLPSLAWPIGERGGARTHDPLIKSHVLYRLSYALTKGSRWLPSAVDPSGTISTQTPPAFVARENRLIP